MEGTADMMARVFSLPRADAHRLRWEMFWPCVTLVAICAAPLGWGLGPLIFGGTT
jgi:hypothetical protein